MIDIYRLRIKNIIKETKDAKSFVLENLGKKPLNYQSGQFLTLLFKRMSGAEIRRSYSISSSPKHDKDLTITVKKIPNGEFSRKLVNHAIVGDILESTGASGLFTLPLYNVQETKSFCFMAAGSGITPVYSIIKTLLYNYPNSSVLLIYSNANQSTAIFFQELLQLNKYFKDRFRIEFLFSESSSIFESRLTQMVIDMLVNKYTLYQRKDTLFYLCGPQPYMRMISLKLRADGVGEERIKKELFVIDRPILNLPEPPDKNPHRVMAVLNGKHFSMDVQYPTSILQAAKKLKVPMPYSCENGQCGSCVAYCIKGKVWMRYNEVLGEKALAEGYVLTCTGYPIGGPVELKF